MPFSLLHPSSNVILNRPSVLFDNNFHINDLCKINYRPPYACVSVWATLVLFMCGLLAIFSMKQILWLQLYKYIEVSLIRWLCEKIGCNSTNNDTMHWLYRVWEFSTQQSRAGMRIIVHFAIIISLNNDENRCMHPYSRASLHFYDHNFPFTNRKLENLSFRTGNTKNLLQKFFQTYTCTMKSHSIIFLHCHLKWICMRRLMYKVTTVWKVSTIFSCNFVVANFPIHFYFALLFSLSLSLFDVGVVFLLCDTCKFTPHNLGKTSTSHFEHFHRFGCAIFYLPNHSSNGIGNSPITQIIIAKDTLRDTHT